MNQEFATMLTEGGKKNSLGRVGEVIDIVLADTTRLDELYHTIFNDDAWVRMRAIDGFEKVCRVHPDWIEPYIDNIQTELATSPQPSIQWHIAEIYRQVSLSSEQKWLALSWLTDKLGTVEVDWIVASNSMETLAYFARQGEVRIPTLLAVLRIQTGHKSSAVTRRAYKLLEEFSTLKK